MPEPTPPVSPVPAAAPAAADRPPAAENVAAVETIISWLLRIGVVTSLAIVIIGTVVSFIHHPGYLWSKKELPALTTPGRAIPHSIREVAGGILAGRGQAIISAGLLLLIATPVLRVAVSIVAFLREKDRLFAAITTVVLLLLLLSFFLGKGE